EVGNGDALVRQVPLRPAEDRQELRRDRVPVLQPAVTESALVDLPPTSDGGQSVGRRPAGLVESVERELAAPAADGGGEFRDAEVLGPLLQLHADMISPRATSPERARRPGRPRSWWSATRWRRRGRARSAG